MLPLSGGSNLSDDIFTEYQNCYIYVERTLENGSIRKGIVGMVDLDAYDYCEGATSPIRATERTVTARIPPRQRVRENAPIELPHIIMLCDDHEDVLIGPIDRKKNTLPRLYDFDLMEGGGHIAGWLVTGEHAAAFDLQLFLKRKTRLRPRIFCPADSGRKNMCP